VTDDVREALGRTASALGGQAAAAVGGSLSWASDEAGQHFQGVASRPGTRGEGEGERGPAIAEDDDGAEEVAENEEEKDEGGEEAGGEGGRDAVSGIADEVDDREIAREERLVAEAWADVAEVAAIHHTAVNTRVFVGEGA